VNTDPEKRSAQPRKTPLVLEAFVPASLIFAAILIAFEGVRRVSPVAAIVPVTVAFFLCFAAFFFVIARLRARS
jgi:hypothetical protein